MKAEPSPDRVDGSDADRESGKVTELFHRCLDLPPEQHDGFLERSCSDDPELRRQLELLLRADAEAGSFLREPFYTPPSDMAPAGKSSSQVLDLLWGGAPARQLDLGELAAGVVLADRYRIVDAIGSGGMGAVYRAEDLKIGQTVALKLLHPTLQQCEHTLRRFLDEVRIARQITDANVCRVYDVVEAGGLHFISMEYIAGQNLDDLLRRGEGLALEQATDLARQICRGLAAAHRAGVLHRDLKPANLMIDPEGTVKVTDFGLAAAGGRVTGREARNGTPAYMAPEQRTGREATVQSDLYALGVVLHQLFTGTRPDADGPQARIELPQGIQAVIDRCLQHDPQDRPDSVDTVTRAFCDEVETAVRTLVVIRGAEPDTATEAILTDASIEGLLRRYRGRRIGGAPDLLLFERPADAIRFALDGHRRLALDERSIGVAIHLVEIATLEATAARLTRASFAGCELEIAATLSSLARGRQTLITRGAFDLARSHSIPGFENASWLAHGSYEIEGLAMPLAICEVGVGGFAPLQKPRESTRVRPQIIQPTLTGWRPAPGLSLPQRDRWVIERKLGEGGFGEVWLARHKATPEQRIFKFCYDPTSLRTLKREITLFKLLKETLGERRDISRILDWNFDRAPYYIEAEFTVGGSLDQWVREQGGLSAVPLAVRLEIVAQVATALAAAHSVGVLHKDVKPANVLITGGADGRVQAKLSDFGLGLLTERERLAEVGVTALGFTEMISEVLSGSSQAGTRLYMAPELLEGKAATLQSDLYALGIMLYQMVVGDLSRALAPGWERDIDDPLLVEDISLAVDGDAERRLDSGLRLAERLRQLALRRQREEQRRQELAEARQATEALARARRRWKFAVAGLLVLALFAATVLFQARRIAQEAAATEAVSEFITDFMVILDPINGRQQKLNPRQVLEATIEKIDTDLQDQPKTQAKLLLEVGTVLLSLGNQKEAEQLLRRAVEMNRQWAGRHPERLADALHNLADVLRQLGELEEASAAVDEALALRRRIGDQAAVARSLALRGLVSHHQVDTAAAEVDFREALRLGEANGAEAEFIAETTVRLGVLLRGTRRYEEALTSFEKARASYVPMFGPEHAKIAFCDQFSAEVLAAIGQVEQAERLQWQALKMRERIFEAPHPEIAHSYLSLGNFLGRQGQFEAAESAIKEALVGYRSLGIGHPYVAAALHDLSALYEAQGRIEEARTAMMEALEIRISAHGEEGPMTLHSREVLARLAKVSR